MQQLYSQAPSGLNVLMGQQYPLSSLARSPKIDHETTQQGDCRRQGGLPLDKKPGWQDRQNSIVPAEGINSDSHARALFQPFWLRRPLLIGLLATFTALWLALVILYHVASSERGLSLTVTSNHYAWTYGPTVILTFVLSFWRQVDYYCKLTQPWREMTAKPATPQQSVLLDYVSPMYATSLYKALRKGHFPVAASITSFLLLKLVLLVSTGLLNTEPISYSSNRPVQLSSNFNASKIWDGISDRGVVLNNLQPGYQNVTSAILWAYLDQLNGQAPDATRVKDDKIFQSFEILESSDNITSARAAVNILSSKVTCEAAQVKSAHQNMTKYIIPLEFDSTSCSFTVPETTEMEDQKYNATLLGYALELADCSTDTYSSSGETNMSNAHFAIAAIAYRNPIFPTGNFRKTDPDENAIIKANAVVCKVDYNIQRADLIRNLLSDEIELIYSGDNATATLDMTSTEMSRYIEGSLNTGSTELKIESAIVHRTMRDEARSMFQLMYKHLGPSANNESFFDQETLRDSATSVFQGLVLQVAESKLLQPAKIDSTGVVTISVVRLQIRKAPLIVMIVSLALLTCLTLVIMLVVRRHVVPQKPGSIASYAAILAKSSTLQSLLENTGRMRTSELVRKLEGFQYQVVHSDHAFEIEASGGKQDVVHTTKPKVKHTQWIPWAARIPLLALVFALPLLAIAILELLQQSSNRNDGVVELHNGDSDAISYVIRYGSVLAVLLVATLFNNLDFTIATLTPFDALRSGKASAKESISLNVVGQVPLMALFSCLRLRHFGTALSIFAGFVSSFLTIISSGLWVADNQVLTSVNVTNALGSTWDLTWSNGSADDAGASQMLNTLDFGGSNDPVGTWTSFAIPMLGKSTTNSENDEALDPTSHDDNLLQRYAFDIDGLQPELNCTVCPKEDIRFDETPTGDSLSADQPIMSKSLVAYFQLSASCRNTDSKNSTFINLKYTFDNDSNGEPTLIGKFYELNVTSAQTDPSSLTKPAPGSEGCPSVGILFGHFYNITALLCSQKIRSVPINTAYSGDPAANILDTQKPPVVNESASLEYMIDAPTGLSTFSYRVAQHFNDSSIGYFPTTEQDLPSAGHMEDIDPIFDHLLHGPYNVSEADILGQDSDHAQNFTIAINKIYNRYMVQVLNTVLRRSPPELNATTETTKVADGGPEGQEEAEGVTVNGKLIKQTTRLKMNNASKLTLQIMLAVMIVLSGTAVRLVKIRGTLPRDPYSVASVMGFLAGSTVCDRESASKSGSKSKVKPIIPPGSEFLSLDQLTKVFDGRKFRLGWWSVSSASQSPSPLPLPDAADRNTRSGRITSTRITPALPGRPRTAYTSVKKETTDNDERWDSSPADEGPGDDVLSEDHSRFGIDIETN